MITYFRNVRSPDDRSGSAVHDTLTFEDAAERGLSPMSSASQNGRLTASGGERPPARHGGVVTIIEPRTLLRDCMVRYLAMFCGASVGGCAGVDELLAENAANPPDLIVLSAAQKPPHAALNEVAALREAGLTAPAILLVDSCDPAITQGAFRNGIRGVIPATVPGNVAVEVIRLVLAGGTFIPPEALITRPRDPLAAPDTARNRLTMREEQIMALLRHGKQNKQIAYELSLSEGTVKVHVHNIMRKFGATNRTQLLAIVT